MRYMPIVCGVNWTGKNTISVISLRPCGVKKGGDLRICDARPLFVGLLAGILKPCGNVLARLWRR